MNMATSMLGGSSKKDEGSALNMGNALAAINLLNKVRS